MQTIEFSNKIEYVDRAKEDLQLYPMGVYPNPVASSEGLPFCGVVALQVSP
jgi:hypothetical protein